MALLFKDSMQTLLKAKNKSNLNERMSSMLEVNIEKQMATLEKGFTFLATVGSTAPFIGLFGTVWGIMNSFQSIAISRNTKFSYCCTWYSRGFICNSFRIISGNPSSCCL